MKKSSNKKWILNFKWILWWKQDQDELKKQVENYNSLKIIKSYRGISTLLIIFSAFLTLGFSLTGWIDIPFDEAILTAAFYLTLAYFIYKGKKWAMIGMMIVWTFEKAYDFFIYGFSANPVLIFVWWVIFMRYLFSAYQVEKLRRQASGSS